MNNNDVIRSIRYLTQLNNTKISDILNAVEYPVPVSMIDHYVKRQDEPDYILCPDEVMANFLNGLIIFKRGKDESRPVPPIELPITNNIILKKLRIAFELKDVDIMQIYTSIDFRISKPELSALFRTPDNKNYRPCGDQLLRYFLKGLTQRERS